MNISRVPGSILSFLFSFWRVVVCAIPGGRVSAFGAGPGNISKILVINLDRQQRRWTRVTREISRFKTREGISLALITERFSAVDARDGRAVAATADVDPIYYMKDQVFVQPDPRLSRSFGPEEPVRMTKQEVAVARSHIEVWKRVAAGAEDYVLVLEDDVWFKPGARGKLQRGWAAALYRMRNAEGGPELLYFSFDDAGGTACRMESCGHLFRPLRGLWFLSGYVLSRTGARKLLRAMPVVGPVDLWMNYRYPELRVLALASPAVLQRRDVYSDNLYSILPFLARAGIVDSESISTRPNAKVSKLVLAWDGFAGRDSIAMALSMLGLRVKVCDSTFTTDASGGLDDLFDGFDALVNTQLSDELVEAVVVSRDVLFIFESDSATFEIVADRLPAHRIHMLSQADGVRDREWGGLCTFLEVPEPAEPFPVGSPKAWGTFRKGFVASSTNDGECQRLRRLAMDDSPWILPERSGWVPRSSSGELHVRKFSVDIDESNWKSPDFRDLTETFPGNLASFCKEGVFHRSDCTLIKLTRGVEGSGRYRSGAISSVQSYLHGRFEVEMKPARGAGLVTGFFLHRHSPRQEIDIEFLGDCTHEMMVNVFFNPGDELCSLDFGYRGSPCRIDLGFDAALDFHIYAIEWRPGLISWSVDGVVVHERVGWDPTPIPHLEMTLHANLWAPRSEELAGRVCPSSLPASAVIRRVRALA